jgi:hypothetical protein
MDGSLKGLRYAVIRIIRADSRFWGTYAAVCARRIFRRIYPERRQQKAYGKKTRFYYNTDIQEKTWLP